MDYNHHHYHQEEDTSNDELIARALAAEQDAAIASSNNNNNININNNPMHHNEVNNNNPPRPSMGMFTYPGALRRSQREIPRGRIVDPSTIASSSSSTPSLYNTPSPAAAPYNAPNAASAAPLPPMFGGIQHRKRSHMCHVPCIIGDRQTCVEMMVDTGAESSVISMELARDLGLDRNIDRRMQGVAAGVGRAKIVGMIRNVVVTFLGGNVEFLMEFIVLEMPGKMLLLGMDQMRKYNCIIDLPRDVLIFGGAGGVEVPMLPPDKEPTIDYASMGEMCTIS